MTFYFKRFLVLLLPIQMLIGNNITIDAPKILLKNVGFNISFIGSFNPDDSFTLNHNGKIFSPSSVTNSKIKFENITTDALGNASFKLEKNSIKIHGLKKYVIRPWVSILPPLIAITLAFLTKSIVPSLFVAIWFGSWAVNGLTFGGIFTGLLDSFNVFILNTILDRDHAVIALFTLMLGGNGWNHLSKWWNAWNYPAINKKSKHTKKRTDLHLAFWNHNIF